VLKYLVRRLLFGLPTLVGISVIVFVVMRVLPGDPLVAMFGAEGFQKLSADDRARIMTDLGLSDPLPVQYARWMKDIVTGSLGRSFFRGDRVSELILHRGPLSAEIGLLSVLISWIVGLPVGIVSAFRPNSLADNVVLGALPRRPRLLARGWSMRSRAPLVTAMIRVSPRSLNLTLADCGTYSPTAVDVSERKGSSGQRYM